MIRLSSTKAKKLFQSHKQMKTAIPLWCNQWNGIFVHLKPKCISGKNAIPLHQSTYKVYRTLAKYCNNF